MASKKHVQNQENKTFWRKHPHPFVVKGGGAKNCRNCGLGKTNAIHNLQRT